MKKHSLRKIILSIIIAAIVSYAIYFLYIFGRYRYKTDFGQEYKKYSWIIKDSAWNKIDTNFRFSDIETNNVVNYCIYENKYKYYITFWVFKRTGRVDIKHVPFIQNIDLESVKWNSGTILNAYSSPEPEITVRFGFNFNKGIIVNIDNKSIIDTFINTKYYRSFYGVIHKMSISDKKGKHLILFNYSKAKEYTLFILYPKKPNLYFLIVDSESPFDPNDLIKIFNIP